MHPNSHGAFTASIRNGLAMNLCVRVRVIRCCMKADPIWDKVVCPVHGDDLKARKYSIELLFLLARGHTSVEATQI